MAGGLMFLLDTNIWLELLLDQEKAADVRSFLTHVEASEIAMTDFALHSIALALTRLKKSDLFIQFLSDVIVGSTVTLVRLNADELEAVIVAHQNFSLDFDDAYQYVAAEIYNLTIISLDADFDRTKRGRKTPGDIIAQIGTEERPQSEDES